MERKNIKRNKSLYSPKDLGKNNYMLRESDIEWLRKLNNKFWFSDLNRVRRSTGNITEPELRCLVTLISMYNLPTTVIKNSMVVFDHETQYGLPPVKLLQIGYFSFSKIKCGQNTHYNKELQNMVYLIEPILYSKRNLELLDWYDLPKPLEEPYKY